MKKSTKNLVLGKIIERLQDLLPSPEIATYAACNPTNAELFFSEEPSEIAKAREICMSCPVRQLCLDHHMVVENEGTAGGLTADERRKARNGAPVFFFDDVNEAIRVQRDMKYMSAGAFAECYGITERTYFRWKSDLEGQGLAS